MATDLDLDDSLIEEAVVAGQHLSREEAVNAALREYVESRRRVEILEWVGEVDYYEDYDHKQLCRGESTGSQPGLIGWLLSCPEKDFFVRIESESTETLTDAEHFNETGTSSRI